MGRVDLKQQWTGGAWSTFTGFEYTAKGQRWKMKDAFTASISPDKYVEYQYEDLGRLQTKLMPLDATTAASLSSYTPSGALESITTDKLAGTSGYLRLIGYPRDALHRITEEAFYATQPRTGGGTEWASGRSYGATYDSAAGYADAQGYDRVATAATAGRAWAESSRAHTLTTMPMTASGTPAAVSSAAASTLTATPFNLTSMPTALGITPAPTATTSRTA